MVTVLMIRSHFNDSKMLKEARSLKNAGYNVKLLVWNRRREKPTVELRQFPVISISVPAPKGPLVVLFLPLWFAYLTYYLAREEYDVVHAIDFDTILPSIIVGKFLRSKHIVYDIFDLYSEQISLPGWLRKIIFKFDLYVMRYVDAIILVDKKRIRQLMQFGGVPSDILNKVTIIMNTPPENLCTDIKRATKHPMASCNPFKPLLIFYAGVLIRGRALTEIAEIVGNIGKSVFLQMYGVGESYIEKQLQRIASRYENIKIECRWIQYPEVLKKTFESDILFAIYDPKIPNNQYASPNKVFEAMLCGKPIIVSRGTSDDIVEQNKCGITVDYDNIGEIKNAIIKLRDNPKLRKKLGYTGRRAYEKKYNWEVMEERLLKIYEKMC